MGNGRIIVSKPLYVALAQRKEDRKAFGSAICSTSLRNENAAIRTNGTTNGISTTAVLPTSCHAPTSKVLRCSTSRYETRRCTPLGPTRPEAHATQLRWCPTNGPWSKQASKQQNDGRRSSNGTRPNGHAHEYGRHGSCPSRHATKRCQPSRYATQLQIHRRSA